MIFKCSKLVCGHLGWGRKGEVSRGDEEHVDWWVQAKCCYKSRNLVHIPPTRVAQDYSWVTHEFLRPIITMFNFGATEPSSLTLCHVTVAKASRVKLVVSLGVGIGRIPYPSRLKMAPFAKLLQLHRLPGRYKWFFLSPQNPKIAKE